MNKTFGISLVASLLSLAIALPVIGQTTNTTTPTATSTHSMAGEVNLVCMQNAVLKRETAIASALDAYYNAEKAALTARTSALNSAWGIADRKARRAALKSAWKTFQD